MSIQQNEFIHVIDRVGWALKELERVADEIRPHFAQFRAKAQESVQTVKELQRLLNATRIGLGPVPVDTRMPSRAYVPTSEQRNANAILAAMHAAGYTEEQTIQELFQAYERLLAEHRKVVQSTAFTAMIFGSTKSP